MRGAYSGRLTGGIQLARTKPRRRPLSGADDMPGQNAAQAVIRTAYRGDSACQDKPAQMIFRTAYRGDSAGQDKAAQMIFRRRRSSICQDKARRLFRTAYRGDSACQDKPAQMIFRTKRGAGGYQDGLSGGFSRPGQAGADDLSGQNAAQAVIRTAYRGDSACQDRPAQMIFQDKTRRRRLSGRLIGGIQLARTRRRR